LLFANKDLLTYLLTLKALEGHEFRAVTIPNTVTDLLSWLRNPGFPFVTAACEMAMTNAA
jgi:hypothetical protein